MLHIKSWACNVPQFREWVVNYPAYWTPAQGRAYMQDTVAMLNQAIAPSVMALGPAHAAAMCLSVVTSIARGNPVYVADIQKQMANAYDLVGQLNAFEGATKQ